MKATRPIHVFLFMLCCMAALALMCVVLPQEITIHTPQLGQLLEVELDSVAEEKENKMEEIGNKIEEIGEKIKDIEWRKPAPVALAEVEVEPQLQPEPQPQPQPEPEPQPQPQLQPQPEPQPQAEESVEILEEKVDTRIYLSKFYAALEQADTKAVRVVHYGDSQIEEDRITTQLRRALQHRYGGGGVGIIPLHQTIPTRTICQSIMMNGRGQSINQGPKRYLVYGPKSMRRNNSKYGIMGQVAVMDNTLVAGSEDILMEINGPGKSKDIESYFNRIRVIKSGDVSVSIARATHQEGDMYVVPDSTCSATIHFTGKGDVYGISFEQDKGVMVDNIPMRGCSGAVFTSMGPNEMQAYFQSTNTSLIILQFGGNIMPYTTTRQQVAQYISKMQVQIQYIKYLAPESSIMFVGPSDMSERRDGVMQTYKMIPVMDAALEQMAIEEEIGYFSLYRHMGGKGSMLEWKEKGWAGSDYVHFTRKGAEKAGEMMAEWLMR